LGVITVGRRASGGDPWTDQGRLKRTAVLLRGTAALVPRGVFRFRSFDEADEWMTRMMIATHERLNPRTSSASAGR